MASNAPARTAARSRLAAIALVTLIGTGCSNVPAETGDIGDQSGPVGPPPSPAELQELLEKRRESARCMRENGVEDFPDPDANGHIMYYGDDPDMKATSEKCFDLMAADRGSK